MQRKLASVAVVHDVQPIEGADRIEEIKVLGWTLVSRKGEFVKGDKCVYFEIDSVLPELPMFEFIKRGSDKSKFMRLRTIKLKGVISQGLAMPVKILHEFDKQLDLDALVQGTDVTALIGVEKYEPPPPRGARQDSISKGAFPFYVPKTDETRIQSSPDLIKEFNSLQVIATVKLDGCSATFVHRDGEYSVCSRNLNLRSFAEKEELIRQLAAKGKETYPPRQDRWWEMSEKYGIREKLAAKGNFSIQGEICGPGIQKNRLELKANDLFVYNVYNLETRRYLCHDECVAFAEELGLKVVPVAYGPFVFDHTQEQLLDMAEGKYEGTANEREGIVIRPIEERYSPTLSGRLSVKVISNKFLLKGGD